MRAIDADAFKDYIRSACEEMKHLYKDNGAWAKEITESFCKDIDEQPTIQPEIVRCGECKWFQCNMRPDGYLSQGVDEFECRHWCGSCDPTDFCSYAERRTNG